MQPRFTPEQRTRALLYYFGWQGGTIHQLAKETGCDVQTLLHGDDYEKIGHGFSAIRTCDKEWRVEKLAPQHQGEWNFWLSAIAGFYATGPLDGRA